MKNIILKLSLLSLFAIGVSSCEEETGAVLNPDNGTNLYSFNLSRSTLAVTAEVKTDTIEVGVTSRSNVDRTIAVNIDPSSTATAAQYNVPSSVVIPAGKFIGKLVLTANEAEIPDGEIESTLVFTLDDALANLDEKNFHVVTIYKPCAYESLAGTHTYVQTELLAGTGGIDSGSPVNGTLTGTVQFTDTAVIGRYLISDSSFGMYEAVYGDAPAPFATNPAGIAWSCTGAKGFGKTQYGNTETFYLDVTAVNGPVLTLVWYSTYGDGGTVELTREGGADWPVELVTQ
jgi:hypothetical protein